MKHVSNHGRFTDVQTSSEQSTQWGHPVKHWEPCQPYPYVSSIVGVFIGLVCTKRMGEAVLVLRFQERFRRLILVCYLLSFLPSHVRDIK